MIAHVNGRGPLAGGIASGFWFAEAEGTDHFTLGQRHQVFLLLLFAGELLQAPTHQGIVHAHHHTGASVDLADLFHRQHVADGIHTTAAVLGIHHHTQETELAKLFDLRRRETLFPIAVDHAGLQHVLREVAGGVAHGDLFFAQFEIQSGEGGGVLHSVRCTGQK